MQRFSFSLGRGGGWKTITALFVYVIAWEGVKFGINFTSCSENGNEIARGATECYFAVIATTRGIYPKISLLPVLSQINTIASFFKVKISDFQTRFLACCCSRRVMTAAG